MSQNTKEFIIASYKIPPDFEGAMTKKRLSIAERSNCVSPTLPGREGFSEVSPSGGDLEGADEVAGPLCVSGIATLLIEAISDDVFVCF